MLVSRKLESLLNREGDTAKRKALAQSEADANRVTAKLLDQLFADIRELIG